MSWLGKPKTKAEDDKAPVLTEESLDKAFVDLHMLKAQEKAYNAAMKAATSHGMRGSTGSIWMTGTTTTPSGLSGLSGLGGLGTHTYTTTAGSYFTLDYLMNFELVKSTSTGELYLYNHGNYYTITGMQIEVVEHCEFICTLGQLLSTVNDKAKK